MPVGRVVKTNNYCKKVLVDRKRFDRRSFRAKRVSKRTLLTIACPKGQWDSIKERCKVGTRVQRILKRKLKSGLCPKM